MWTKGKSDAKLPSGVKVVLTGVEVVDADGAVDSNSGVVKAVVSAIERSGFKVELANGKAGDHSNSAKKEDAKAELPTGAKEEDAKAELPTGAKKEDAKAELPTGAKKVDAKAELPTGVKARREISPAEAEALLAASAGLRSIISDDDPKAKKTGDAYPTKVAIYVHSDSKPDLFVYYDMEEFNKLFGVDIKDTEALEDAAAAFYTASRGLSLDSEKLTGAMRRLELYNEGYNERRAQAFQAAFQEEVRSLERDLRVEIQAMENSLRRDLAHGENLAAVEIFCAKRCAALAELDPEQAAAYAAAVCAFVEAQEAESANSFIPRSDNLELLEPRKFGIAKRFPNKVMHCTAGPVSRIARKVIYSPQAKRLARDVQAFLKGEGKEATIEEILKVLEFHPRFVEKIIETLGKEATAEEIQKALEIHPRSMEKIIETQALEDARAMERAAKRQLWKDLEEDFYRWIKFGATVVAGVAVLREWEMNMEETPEHQESFFE